MAAKVRVFFETVPNSEISPLASVPAGIGRPAAPAPLNLAEDKDSDFLYLKPMFDNVLADGFTVFDLRSFRPDFRSIGPVDRELERLIFGYDFLVLIPHPAASHPLTKDP